MEALRDAGASCPVRAILNRAVKGAVDGLLRQLCSGLARFRTLMEMCGLVLVPGRRDAAAVALMMI